MPKLSELFTITYGHSLEFCRLVEDPQGVCFVSRSGKNNGVTGRVKQINGIDPSPAGIITVALGGSVLSSFLQQEPSYQGRDMITLVARQAMTDTEKLWYCKAIEMNAFRYSYGRQANKTLKDLEVPLCPDWAKNAKLPDFSKYEPLIKEFPQLLYLPVEEFIPTLEKLLASAKPISDTLPALTNWKHFKLFDLFTLVRGSSLTKNQAEEKTGTYPFLSASRYNNGETARTGDWGEEYQRFCGHCLAIVANGAPGYTFYQAGPFYASVDIVIARPKVEVSVHALLFVATVITNERYRFNYGRKFTGARQNLNLWLPAKEDGIPNWDLMDQYMKGLRFSGMVPTPAVL